MNILLDHTDNLQHLRHFSMSQFPLWDTPPDHRISFGYDPDEDDDEPSVHEIMDGLSPIGVDLKDKIIELASTLR